MYLLKQKFLPTEVDIFTNTILRPILIYKSKCWALTTKPASTAEMKVLGTIRGVTRLDRIRNGRIRSDLSVKPILRVIEESKLKWYGHAKWMEHTRLAQRHA